MATEDQQRWKASWYERGRLREAVFYAPANRAIARIDFQLQLQAQGQPCPPVFELDEADRIPQLPQKSHGFIRGED